MVVVSSTKRRQDLATFRDLAEVLPATKIGTIVALLPQIEGLQRRGHKTRAIWQSLSADGVEISYDLFRLYLTRARRKSRKFGSSTVTARPKAVESCERSQAKDTQHSLDPHESRKTGAAAFSAADPFAGVRKSRTRKMKEQFDYDPLAPLKDDLLR
jgi:hypothetical protein